MSTRKPHTSEHPSRWLTLHRVLTGFATICVGVLTALSISFMNDWARFKDQAVRMETVPGDVREIKTSINSMDKSIGAIEHRVTTLEKRP